MPAVSKRRRRTCYLCGPTFETRFAFPVGRHLVAWKQFCKNFTGSDEMPKSVYLCIKHFDKSEIITGEGGTRIRRSAIPIIRTSEQYERLKKCNLRQYEDIIANEKNGPDLTSEIKNNFQNLIVRISNDMQNSLHNGSVEFKSTEAVPNETLQSDVQIGEPSLSLNDGMAPKQAAGVICSPVFKMTHLKDTTPIQRQCNPIERRPRLKRALRFISDINTPALDEKNV